MGQVLDVLHLVSAEDDGLKHLAKSIDPADSSIKAPLHRMQLSSQ